MTAGLFSPDCTFQAKNACVNPPPISINFEKSLRACRASDHLASGSMKGEVQIVCRVSLAATAGLLLPNGPRLSSNQPQEVGGALDQIEVIYRGLYSWKADHSMGEYIKKLRRRGNAAKGSQ